jgi:hypothetical protein
MKNYIWIIIVFVIFIVFYITIADFSPKDDVLLNKITELELKIDSLKSQKDSIRISIDSTHVKIITNEKHYKEIVNSVLSKPDSVVDLWSKQYIDEYRKRLVNGQ